MNIMTKDSHWHSLGFYAEQRMTCLQETQWKYDRRQEMKKEQGCIKVEPKKGSRFDVWA